MLWKNPVGPNGPRRGTVVVLVAILLVVLLGILAIALDGGVLLDDRRRLQGVADAAAQAAANELFRNYPTITSSSSSAADPGGTAAAAALASAAENGYPNGGAVNVTVNIPPTSGPFTGQRGMAEVILTYQQPRFFSRIWGSTDLTVSARAVGRGLWKESKIGILVLDPTQQNSLDASGTGGVTVTGGASVIVDSNDPASAARVTGGGGISAPDFEITGGANGPLNGVVHTGQQPQPDPLRNLPVPAVPPDGTMTVVNLGQGNKQYTLTPGRYNNLPNFSAGDVVILKQASAGNGGIYYLDGGGLKSTGATIIMDPLTTGGVMLYNHPSSSSSNQQIQITGNASGTVSLSPLTSGPYAGILLWEDRTSTVPLSISGNGTFNLLGTFYAANAQLQIQGNGNATIGSQYISRTLSLSGNGNIHIDYSDNNTARTRFVGLVE
jgi:type II secretory pathway pseudopilin PulG